MPKFASLDVGSNTVRLLIAEAESPQEFRPLRVERIITRLGGGFSESGKMAEASMERTIEAIRTLTDLCRRERAEKIFAVGTGVLRAASNRGEFLERVKRRTSVSLRVVSGVEEARLMLRGVLWSIQERHLPRLVADIGGWSTEILWAEGETPLETASLDLGVVAFTEKFLKHDPPLPEEVGALENRARKIIREVREAWEGKGRSLGSLHGHLVGTAGTATTLAAMDLGLAVYDPRKISGHRISLEGLRGLYLRLRSLPSGERLKLPGLEKGREDLIVAGAAIMILLLEGFDRQALEAIDSGLLEGVLLEGMKDIADFGFRNAD
jgi:exopolyphosphatase/guanosine-5'-triphosphate,3'-diphosphate pyrophosphatase